MRKPMGWRKASVMILLGGALGIALAEGPPGSDKSAAEPEVVEPPRLPGEGDVAEMAKTICRIAVPTVMNDPGSVEFVPRDQWVVTLGEDHKHVVRLALRAKNAFNATVYGEFDCFVEDRGEDVEALRVVQVSP